jgi:hypothetical protein
MRWVLPSELSEREEEVAQLLKRTGKFYLLLRRAQPRLFDEPFQAELAQAYGATRGRSHSAGSACDGDSAPGLHAGQRRCRG